MIYLLIFIAYFVATSVLHRWVNKRVFDTSVILYFSTEASARNFITRRISPVFDDDLRIEYPPSLAMERIKPLSNKIVYYSTPRERERENFYTKFFVKGDDNQTL